MDADGVTFQSHIDGSTHRLTPARSIEIQADLLGADISMQLDECTDFPCTEAEAERSLKLSLDWGQRSLDAFGEREKPNFVWGLFRGLTLPRCGSSRLRASLHRALAAWRWADWPWAEGHEQMCATIDMTVLHLPDHMPRYVMGVGKPIDLVESVARGIDMFDCVLPTRSGRHGQAWTWDGPINLKNSKFKEDLSPIDAAIACEASNGYSRAYLHHLFKAGEYLGPMVLSWHNTAFFQALMAEIRMAILEGPF